MEFGKLSHIEAVDFTLPADHPGIVKVLGQQKAAHCKVHVGCPIWAGEGFVGKIYPLKAQRKDYLKLYAKHFNSIELNVSHYKQPDTEQIQRWADMTSSDFIFCPKINQTISHTPILIQNVTMMKDFLNQQKAFHEKLGMPFFQLPNSYDSSKLNDLLDFFDQVAMSGFAVELRHESWFSNEAILKQVCNYFYKNNLTFLMTDVAGRRDVLHQRLTSKTAFIRFIANDLHPTDFERMDAWTERFKIWIDNGLEQLYFFVHTPSDEALPELVSYFNTSLEKKTGIVLRKPAIIPPSQPNHTLF